MGNSKGFAPVALLLYGGVVLLASLAGFLGYKEYQLKQKTLGVETSMPTVIPSTPTPLPTATTKPYVNPDPIVNCGPGVNSKQYIKDKQSNCKNYVDCGLNNNTTWTLILKTECDKKHAEANQNTTTNTTTTSTYTPPTYYTCTLCYHYSTGDQCTTYTSLVKTKAECDSEQTKIDSYGSSYTVSNPTPQPTFDVNAYNAQVEQCQCAVVDRYGDNTRIQVNCSVQFGDSSATEACIQINTQNRQKAYDACGKKM